jgi:uncharacterized repeat protein (TIGR01451 family)
MSMPTQATPNAAPWPRWWRWSLLTVAVLILSSCRAAHHKPLPGVDHQAHRHGKDGGIPPTSQPLPYPDPGNAAHVFPAMGGPPAIPYPDVQLVECPWAPPGLALPWPRDEYLFDGGDRELPANVTPQYEVRGVESEDTIAHFDTLDGRVHVQPSNRVCLYAPRFAAVRKVGGVLSEEQVDALEGIHRPEKLIRQDTVQLAAHGVQNVPAITQVGQKHLTEFHMRQGDGAVSQRFVVNAFHNGYLPYEDISLIKFGVLDNADKPRLAIGKNAAIAWTKDVGVQVLIKLERAIEVIGDRRAQATYIFDAERGPARIAICKVASTDAAKPGEIVDFTIRFDNVGDQLIGNVTIVDNLTTRLELVPDSAQCSVPAEFFSEPNTAGSLVLRWEITHPLKPGEGGVCRFKCKVR